MSSMFYMMYNSNLPRLCWNWTCFNAGASRRLWYNSICLYPKKCGWICHANHVLTSNADNGSCFIRGSDAKLPRNSMIEVLHQIIVANGNTYMVGCRKEEPPGLIS